MNLPLVDVFSKPYESRETREASIEEVLQTGNPKLRVNTELKAKVSSALEAAVLATLFSLLERTVAIKSKQTKLLKIILNGPQLDAETFGMPPEEMRNAPKVSGTQPKLDL